MVGVLCVLDVSRLVFMVDYRRFKVSRKASLAAGMLASSPCQVSRVGSCRARANE